MMNSLFENNNRPMRAWVVFTGQTDCVALRVLKKGYRHCFILLHDGVHWQSMDPLLGHIEILVHVVPPDFDMPKWLEGRGHVVVEASLAAPKHLTFPAIFTCVEAVKRALGVQKFFIFTPYQLYRYLTRHSRPRQEGYFKRFIHFITMKGDSAWAA